jgi:hypothetical protein
MPLANMHLMQTQLPKERMYHVNLFEVDRFV